MHVLAKTCYMRLRYPSILVITCFACLGFDQHPASTVTPDPVFHTLELAQASSKEPVNKPILKLGSTGTQVKSLQTLLKKLGYYNGEIDGHFGIGTNLAVTKYQQAKGLTVDGIFGNTTSQSLQTVIDKKLPTSSFSISSTPQPIPQKEAQKDIVWWSLVGIGVLGSFGALLYMVRWLSQGKKIAKYPESYSQMTTRLVPPAMQDFQTTQDGQFTDTGVTAPQETTISPSTQFLPMETRSHLTTKVINITDQLIEDLRSPDPTQRSKAIWDLSQKGDSRAIQPLVDLMINADSQQRSLILTALAEIGTRTLKPMNRALALSLQDESPQVRQNAIRDLTRIYDMMGQMSQMLSHAVHDQDADVQASAKYALSQMNRIRALSGEETTAEAEKDDDGEEQQNKPEND